MALQASDVILSARDELLDNGVSQVWTDATLQRWLSEVLAAAVTLKRDIAPAVIAIPLVPGSVQQVPAGYVQFMAPYFNTSSGVAITPGGIVLLNRRRPAWRSETPTVDVTDVEADQRSPTIFHCFPPNTGGGNITALCGSLPVITASNSPIVVPDNYRAALQAGLMSKCYAANTRRNDIAKAQFQWQVFESMVIGAKTAQKEVMSSLSDATEAGG